jgi:O-antigen/teichoic acid export membrane protein
VFTPQVYDRMFKLGSEGGAAIGRYLTPFAYVSVFAALGLGLFAEEAITLLTPPPFHGAIPIAGILCLHYAIMFFGKLPQLVYARKTGLISLLTLVSLTLNALLNVVFIRQWGAVGAAVGTLSAGMVSIALVLVLGQKYYPIRWHYGSLAAIFGVLFAGLIVSGGMQQAGFEYMPRLGVKLLALAAYASVGVGLGIASRENCTMARTALRRRLAVTGPSC